MSGPGYWPLKPSIVTVRPNSTRRTGAATSVNARPSARRSSSRGRASGIDVVAARKVRRHVGTQRHELGRHADARMHRRRRPRPRRACRLVRRAMRVLRRRRVPGPRKPASRNARSCGCIRTLADVPRSTRRPDRSDRSAEGSAVIRMRIRSNATRPSRIVPLRTTPSFTTGSSCGVVAQATYAVYGPIDAGSGRSRRSKTDVVLRLSGRRNRDAEGRSRREEARGARRTLDRGGRQQLDAIEIRVRAAGGGRIGGARFRGLWLDGRGLTRVAGRAAVQASATASRCMARPVRLGLRTSDRSVTEKPRLWCRSRYRSRCRSRYRSRCLSFVRLPYRNI